MQTLEDFMCGIDEITKLFYLVQTINGFIPMKKLKVAEIKDYMITDSYFGSDYITTIYTKYIGSKENLPALDRNNRP